MPPSVGKLGLRGASLQPDKEGSRSGGHARSEPEAQGTVGRQLRLRGPGGAERLLGPSPLRGRLPGLVAALAQGLRRPARRHWSSNPASAQLHSCGPLTLCRGPPPNRNDHLTPVTHPYTISGLQRRRVLNVELASVICKFRCLFPGVSVLFPPWQVEARLSPSPLPNRSDSWSTRGRLEYNSPTDGCGDNRVWSVNLVPGDQGNSDERRHRARIQLRDSPFASRHYGADIAGRTLPNASFKGSTVGVFGGTVWGVRSVS